jgi:PPOX class probable F420-dependent enzyme
LRGVTPLSGRELQLINDARRAVLATLAPDGTPRMVPIAFIYSEGVVYTPLDEKPKSVTDPRDLARVHDIEQRPRVSLLVDAWDEYWSRLGWLRVHGNARLIDPDGESVPEHAEAVRLLREKYPQYMSHALEARPMIRIELERARSWFAT